MPSLKQQIAGLMSGGQYTFYIWAKVAFRNEARFCRHRGQRLCRLRRGPTIIALTSTWLRFKITDGTETVVVATTAVPPAMFREGIGVVVEGALQADGTFAPLDRTRPTATRRALGS